MPFDTAQQGSAQWVLTGPSGFRAAFNNEADADYIGALTGDEAVTGLDSPEVRSAVYDRVEADGAIFGNFYHGHRPVTMSAQLLAATISERNARENKLYKCVNDMMRGTGTLTWTPTGSISQFVYVRKFQPLRVKGGWAKDIFVSLVAADPYIYGSTQSSTAATAPATNVTVTNEGNAAREPILLKVNGATNGTVILRNVVGSVTSDITFTSSMPNLSAGQILAVDPINRVVRFFANGTDFLLGSPYVDYYRYIDYANTTWWQLAPGTNTVSLRGTNTTGTMVTTHRHAWL